MQPTICNQENSQEIYDSFNDFIFSKDKNVFHKLMLRHDLYNSVKHLHGDIVECGVFKGSGMMTWCKLLQMYEPNSIKKVIGFDMFSKDFVGDLSDDIERDMMSQVFTRDVNLNNKTISLNAVTNRLLNANIPAKSFELIEGDASETTREYTESRPGLLISLLYLDMDLYEPTYNTLQNLWDYITPGGIVVFDEYAYAAWTETQAVDNFFLDKEIEIQNTNFAAPTAYVIKERE